uniref:Uncharacterized protein n=3 Tax=Oryza TaxID=4527 RepID=A0A0E0NU24_ORYRU
MQNSTSPLYTPRSTGQNMLILRQPSLLCKRHPPQFPIVISAAGKTVASVVVSDRTDSALAILTNDSRASEPGSPAGHQRVPHNGIRRLHSVEHLACVVTSGQHEAYRLQLGQCGRHERVGGVTRACSAPRAGCGVGWRRHAAAMRAMSEVAAKAKEK